MIPNIITLTSLLQVGAEPFETLVKTVSRGGTGGLDVPCSLSQAVEAELVSDLCRWHGVWKILLVGKDQEQSIPQFILVEHSLEFLAGFADTLSVVGIDDEDDTLGVLEVMAPEWTNLVLSSNIPHGEGDVLVLNGLNIEADGWDSGDDFTKLELVQNGSLTGGIQSDHKNTHLTLPDQR